MIESVGGTGVGVGGLVLGSIQKISQQQQQQFFLIQPNMISSNGTTTLVALTNQVLKPGIVQILQKPEESNKPVSLKRPLHSPLSYDILSSDDDSKCGFLETEEERKVRKRANLDHLSHEEKMMRRKLKNRVAAQNARDKKKVKMEEMEVTIKMLEQKNRALQKQNQQLVEQNSHLAAENNNLRNETNSGISLNEVVKEEIPFSPASLPPSSQHSMSDLEDDGFEFRPIVESRCGGPAERPESRPGKRSEQDSLSTCLSPLDIADWTIQCHLEDDSECSRPDKTSEDGGIQVGGGDNSSGEQVAAEEAEPLVGIAQTIATSKDLDNIMTRVVNISEFEESNPKTERDSSSEQEQDNFKFKTGQQTSNEDLLDKYISQIQQFSQTFSLDEHCHELFQDLFPDLV